MLGQKVQRKGKAMTWHGRDFSRHKMKGRIGVEGFLSFVHQECLQMDVRE